jgi:hypothetical protein
MNKLSITLASGAALALAACAPPHPHAHTGSSLRTIVRLDCPASQGDLKRKNAATDGSSCDYASDAGAQVTLRLINLDGQDAKTALAPLESSLRAELPSPRGDSADGSSKDRVDIDLPGIHIHANGNTETAATGAAANANGNVAIESNPVGPHGGVTVNAGENGAQIRIAEPGSGIRLAFVLASETPGPHGYRMAGYEARGPVGGPIAVASVLARNDDHDELQDAVRDLLKRNVGG